MGYEVLFSVPKRELGRADVDFEIWQDGAKVGTLSISKGSVVWFPANTTKGHKIDWTAFDRLMTQHVTGEERR